MIMDISITPNRKHLFDLAVDTTLADSIHQELQTQDWTQLPTWYRSSEDLPRFISTNPASTISSNMLKYMVSDFKSALFDVLFADSNFHILWSNPDRTKFDDVTFVWARFVKDHPGYYTDVHIESRQQVAFGQIFLVAGDDPDQSTYFYTDNSRSNPVRAGTGMGTGWCCVNHHESWHQGGNRSNQDRYFLQFSVNLKTG
jgi:hypothetical protein